MLRNDRTWELIAASAAAVGGAIVWQGLQRGWRLAMHDDPPLDPTARDVSWRDAILWTVASGALMGLGRLIARGGAAAGWERLTGETPPV